MFRLQYGNHSRKLIITVSTGMIIGIGVLVLFNLQSQLTAEDAQQRIRILLSRQVTQSYFDFSQEGNLLSEDEALEMQGHLRAINSMRFDSIAVRRLLPDYVLRPHRPTHIVRAELTIDGESLPPRYFWLSWDSIDRETSRVAWYFSL